MSYNNLTLKPEEGGQEGQEYIYTHLGPLDFDKNWKIGNLKSLVYRRY